MTKILPILFYPLGIAAILCAAALFARHAEGGVTASPRGTPGRLLARGGRGGPTGRHGAGLASRYATDPSWERRLARFVLTLIAGAVMIYAVMVLLGMIVVHAGPAIDKPILHWTVTHREHLWKSLMDRATKVANSWTTWGAACAAAVCLACSWRKDRWLPLVILGSLILFDKGLTLAINHTVHRPPPPGTNGIFPSGGSERAIVFYGLIAYLLWREFSGRRATAIWAGAAVAILAFNEGYSRAYLGVHWFTDILSGWFYGCLLLLLFIAAVRRAAGPPAAPAHTPAPGSVGAASAWPEGTTAREVPT
jgi:membrane-associated phospholipid phosphatase